MGHLRANETVEDRVIRLRLASGHRQIPTTYVAIAGEQLLGSACLVKHDMDTRPELSPWLAGVFVAPSQRRRGIGAALIQKAVEEAGLLGIERLYLYTLTSDTFYLKLGWSVLERTFYKRLWEEQEVTIMSIAPHGT